MKDLHRLVYTSARSSSCDDTEIENILKSCVKNNPGKSITGLLLHSDKRFLQVVEGEKEVINALYEKIKVDPRHGGVNLRDSRAITARMFPEWHMAYKDISSDLVEFSTQISKEDKEIYYGMFEGKSDTYGDHGMRVLKTFLAM